MLPVEFGNRWIAISSYQCWFFFMLSASSAQQRALHQEYIERNGGHLPKCNIKRGIDAN